MFISPPSDDDPDARQFCEALSELSELLCTPVARRASAAGMEEYQRGVSGIRDEPSNPCGCLRFHVQRWGNAFCRKRTVDRLQEVEVVFEFMPTCISAVYAHLHIKKEQVPAIARSDSEWNPRQPHHKG